jgi:hypothetical protein
VIDQAKVRIARLTSIGRVCTELGRLYRAARTGKLPSADASRMATILMGMKACMETSEIERRLAEIEAAVVSRENVSPFKPRTAA